MCGLWWTKWNCDRFSPEYFGFPPSISFHRCSVTWKNKKKLIIFLIIFITGLHNKPQGCGASVASAAGPFSNKKSTAHIIMKISRYNDIYSVLSNPATETTILSSLQRPVTVVQGRNPCSKKHTNTTNKLCGENCRVLMLRTDVVRLVTTVLLHSYGNMRVFL
jgi:hypothetical protein